MTNEKFNNDYDVFHSFLVKTQSTVEGLSCLAFQQVTRYQTK